MNLINHLTHQGTWKDFLSEYNAIHQKTPAYANTFAGMLEIAKGLNDLGEDYLVIGGLAVASYLHQMNDQAFRTWRGTADIDLLVPDRDIAEKVLTYSDYHFSQTDKTKEGMIGKLYTYAKQDNGETTVVGLRTGLRDPAGRDITRKMLMHHATVPVYGVGVAIPRIKDLLDMKGQANRKKDRQDIKTLKSMFLLDE